LRAFGLLLKKKRNIASSALPLSGVASTKIEVAVTVFPYFTFACDVFVGSHIKHFCSKAHEQKTLIIITVIIDFF
jgi:hypothetical protein